MGTGQQHFQGDASMKAQVPRPVDDAHAAVAELRLHVVALSITNIAAGG
jgi:hypothetical protein